MKGGISERSRGDRQRKKGKYERPTILLGLSSREPTEGGPIKQGPPKSGAMGRNLGKNSRKTKGGRGKRNGPVPVCR